MWRKAWTSLESKDSIEWELDDPRMHRLLRFNLSISPTAHIIEQDRRRRDKLLTITDITKYRREYETLVEQQQALIRLLMAQGLKSGDPDELPFDESGDTGNRLMAGYLKTEQSLSRQLVLAQEKERKRIAAELHDGIAQSIGVVKYRIEDSVHRLAKKNPHLDLSMLDSTVEEIKSLVDEVRRIASNLSPSMLEDFGIHVALEWLCKEFQVQNRNLSVNCAIRIDEGGTPHFVKVTIYRVVQEALNNILKHASARHVDVFLESADGGIKLVVADDGTGFDPKTVRNAYDGKTGLGLRSMRERVEASGGSFTLQSAPGKGVEIRSTWEEDELGSNR